MPFSRNEYNAHIIKLDSEYELKKELANLNAREIYTASLLDKILFTSIKLENVDTRAANIVKRKLSLIGGVAIMSQEADNFTARKTDLIISGTKDVLKILSKKINTKDYDLNLIAKEISLCLSSDVKTLEVGNKILDFNHKTYIMGEINLRKSVLTNSKHLEKLLHKIEGYKKAQVDIVDIIYYDNNQIEMSKKEESQYFGSIIDIVKKIKREFPDLILSLTTNLVNIVEKLLEVGIDMINDLDLLRHNDKLALVLVKKHCPVILMHNFSTSDGSNLYLSSLIREIESNASFAIGQGIQRDKIIIDPGFGFSENFKENFAMLQHISGIKHLTFPIAIGLSKNSLFDRAMTKRTFKTKISTVVGNTVAIINGANIIRVANVQKAFIMNEIISSIGKNDI